MGGQQSRGRGNKYANNAKSQNSVEVFSAFEQFRDKSQYGRNKDSCPQYPVSYRYGEEEETDKKTNRIVVLGLRKREVTRFNRILIKREKETKRIL